MRHVNEFEEFDPSDFDEEIVRKGNDELETLGFEPFIGYAWCGYAKSQYQNNSEYPLFFLVVGKDDEDCTRQVMESGILRTGSMGTSSSSIYTGPIPESFGEYLDNLQSWGRILDSGHYGPFKAKENERKVVYMEPPYMMNVQQVMEIIKDNFRDVEKVMRDADYSEVFTKKPKDK
jgi:hypothetical protein